MLENSSIDEQINKFKKIRELEHKRKILRINNICEFCGTPMTPEGGCWICYSCGESRC